MYIVFISEILNLKESVGETVYRTIPFTCFSILCYFDDEPLKLLSGTFVQIVTVPENFYSVCVFSFNSFSKFNIYFHTSSHSKVLEGQSNLVKSFNPGVPFMGHRQTE